MVALYFLYISYAAYDILKLCEYLFLISLILYAVLPQPAHTRATQQKRDDDFVKYEDYEYQE